MDKYNRLLDEDVRNDYLNKVTEELFNKIIKKISKTLNKPKDDFLKINIYKSIKKWNTISSYGNSEQFLNSLIFSYNQRIFNNLILQNVVQKLQKEGYDVSIFLKLYKVTNKKDHIIFLYGSHQSFVTWVNLPNPKSKIYVKCFMTIYY